MVPDWDRMERHGNTGSQVGPGPEKKKVLGQLVNCDWGLWIGISMLVS